MRNNQGKVKIAIVLEILGIITILVLFMWRIFPSLVAKFRGETGIPTDITEINKEIALTEEELLNKFVTGLSSGETNINVGIATQSAIDNVIYKIYDTPEFFWLDNSYTISTIGAYSVVNFKKLYDDVDEKKAEIDAAADEILADFPSSADDFTKVRYIHDTLCERITYKDTGSLDDHNIYGALVKGECVCEGYSKAFAYLLDKKGISNLIFSGTANNGEVSENHSWNGVYMDGDLYYFDITWDDQEEYGTMYTYFGMTSSEIKKNHAFDEYHKALETDAVDDNYFVYNGYVMEEFSDETFAGIIAQQGEVIDVKCIGIIAYQDMDLTIENPMKFSQVLTLAGPDYGLTEGYKYLMDENTYSARIFLE